MNGNKKSNFNIKWNKLYKLGNKQVHVVWKFIQILYLKIYIETLTVF